MDKQPFSDTALVLLGHGSSQHAGAGAAVFQHAEALRRKGVFATVREAFWKQAPQIRSVLEDLRHPRVIICPLFMSEGYFAEDRIPQELGFRTGAKPEFARSVERDGRITWYCRPVGTHPAMTSVVLDRARSVVAAFPFPRAPQASAITLVIAGHGTGENADSRVAIEQQVERIRALGVYAGVEAVFLEEAPGIEDCYRLARTRCLVVVPYFVSDGEHVLEDIPIRLGQPKAVVQARLAAGQPSWRNPTEHRERLVWYSSSVGTAPALAEVILARARECFDHGFHG